MNTFEQQPLAQPTQPQAYAQAQPSIQPPNTATFNLDAKTREILSTVHPELLNACVNIAIKKFSVNTDFINYYVREEFKHIPEQAKEQLVPEQEQPTTEKVTQAVPTQAPSANKNMDFSSW